MSGIGAHKHSENNAGIPVHWKPATRGLWHEYQWFFITTLWVATIILGTIGFSKYAADTGEEVNFFQSLYLTLQLFVLHAVHLEPGHIGVELQAARFLAPAVATYTAARGFIFLFYGQLQMAGLGLFKEHVIICGLGRAGTLFARAFRHSGMKVVIIEKDEDNANIQKAKDRGAVVLIGDATDTEMLRKARVGAAGRCIACTDDDGTNIEIALRARDMTGERSSPLRCAVQITSPRLYDLFKSHPLMTGAEIGSFALSTFNVFSRGAEKMVHAYPPFDVPVDEELRKQPPRAVVIGLGQFGQSAVVEIALHWRIHVLKEKIRVLAIDHEDKVEQLDLRFPSIRQFCDLEFRKLDIESPEFLEGKFLFNGDGLDVDTIYVCLDNDALCLQAALNLLPHLKAAPEVKIIIRTDLDKGYPGLIREAAKDKAYENLRAFEFLERTCDPTILGYPNEKLAREFHERYRKQKIKGSISPDADPSVREWAAIPESLRLSNRRQVDEMYSLLHLAGLKIVRSDEPGDALTEKDKQFTDKLEMISMLEHERFIAERMRDGWVFGETKDLDKKINPSIKPWDELTEDVKDYDRHWARELPEMLRGVGYKICVREE